MNQALIAIHPVFGATNIVDVMLNYSVFLVHTFGHVVIAKLPKSFIANSLKSNRISDDARTRS